jgi:hypothetical protein
MKFVSCFPLPPLSHESAALLIEVAFASSLQHVWHFPKSVVTLPQACSKTSRVVQLLHLAVMISSNFNATASVNSLIKYLQPTHTYTERATTRTVPTQRSLTFAITNFAN